MLASCDNLVVEHWSDHLKVKGLMSPGTANANRREKNKKCLKVAFINWDEDYFAGTIENRWSLLVELKAGVLNVLIKKVH